MNNILIPILFLFDIFSKSYTQKNHNDRGHNQEVDHLPNIDDNNEGQVELSKVDVDLKQDNLPLVQDNIDDAQENESLSDH